MADTDSDSNVDDEKLMSLIYVNGNSPTASSAVFCSLQAVQKSVTEKRKNVHSNSEKAFDIKQPRLESRLSRNIVFASYKRYYNKSASRSTDHVSDEITELLCVQNNSPRTSSPHCNDTDTTDRRSEDAICRKSSEKAVATKNRRKKSQLWSQNFLQSRNQKESVSSKKAEKSCLISCRSCKNYIMPDLPEEEVNEMSNYVALDCEFVGVGPKKTDALGRCSIVNHQGHVMFDHFVKPAEEVTDYRTPWSGLRPRHIRRGIPFVAAQEMVAAIIKDKVVIGHAVHNDFRVLGLKHPVQMIRDTAGCKLLRDMANLPNNAFALKKLSSALLGRKIQKKEHCSVTDSRTCLDLFRLVRTQWEPMLHAKISRRAARQLSANSNKKFTDSANDEESDLALSAFFDDKYWPAHVTQDSHHHI